MAQGLSLVQRDIKYLSAAFGEGLGGVRLTPSYWQAGYRLLVCDAPLERGA